MRNQVLNGFPDSQHTTVIDYAQYRLGELVELALEQELVESCHVAKDHVVIALGGRYLDLPPEEARGFLGSLLSGWARSLSTVQITQPIADVRRRSLFTAPAPSGAAASYTPPPAAPNGHLPSEDAPTDEAYMDAVLDCAEKLHLIEGYQKNRPSHRITLQTKATAADMSYFEALQYLSESILEELRPASRA